MLEKLKRANKEGVVFKDSTAQLLAGPARQRRQPAKLKFTATASCIVAGTKPNKRSAALELIDGPKRVAVGNVTIPPNQPIPAAGEVVEVRYLYGYPSGSLYQPSFWASGMMSRSMPARSQLKLKASGEDRDDA